MDESRDYHTKRNQTKINIGYHLYVESLKKKKIRQVNLFTRKKKTDFKNGFMVTKRVGAGGINWNTGLIHTYYYI